MSVVAFKPNHRHDRASLRLVPRSPTDLVGAPGSGGAVHDTQPAPLPRFELPADAPRPAADDGRRITTRVLPPWLIERLGQLGRHQGATLFATGLAALAVVLHRFTGDTMIAVATETAAETPAETLGDVGEQGALGLRLDLSGDPDFRALLARVVHAGRTAQASPARANLTFDLDIGGHRARDVPGTPPELRFTLRRTATGWQLDCDHAAALFEAVTIGSVLDSTIALYRSAIAAPTAPISTLALLDAAAASALRLRENDTARATPDVALPTLLSAQALRGGDRIAVTSSERTLTFRQVEAASNKLARYLRSRGIGAGALVGVCLDRTADLPVTLLGVLKAGAAYVPLDPSYPQARLEQVIDDSGLAAILTTTEVSVALPAGRGSVERMLLDRLSTGFDRDIAAQSAQPLDIAIAPDDLAYVIFTSGSTGRPKGVRIPHRALVNFLQDMARSPGMSARDVLVAVTTIAFDIAGLELFLPLLTGAQLVIADRATAADGERLAGLLAARRATVLQATPVTWKILLEAGWRGPIRMLCGGEALPRHLADRLLATGGELWNMYGPTETTIWSSATRVLSGAGPVPVGPPMANTSFHVLDQARQLVPLGAIGELFIGGAGVADGYLDRPELTAERFLPDPFVPGGTLYRTGDLVRRRPGGGLSFLGRADQQIKLRGYRIELGEIEAALLEDPDVTEAAARLWQPAEEPAGLAAYVVMRRGAAGAARMPSLRAQLRRVLPSYMLPATITVLDSLPRTPNGKLDRAALPAPAAVAGQAEPALLADPTEDKVATIWAATLGLVQVAPDDNFFDLGGHSLLAAQMLNAVEAQFGQRLASTLLCRAPTVRMFAAALRGEAAPPFDYQLVEVQRTGSGTPVFAVGHTWLYGGLARRLGERPFYATQVHEAGGIRDLATTAALHVEIIRHVRPHGPYVLLGLCSAGNLAYEVAQQLMAAGETVAMTVMVDTWAPDHRSRLSWRQALLADWSYRAQMLLFDFRQEGPLDVVDTLRFWGRRVRTFALKHSVGLFRALPALSDPATRLDAASDRYRPVSIACRLLVFFRQDMPAGRFLDPHLGWDVHAAGDLRVEALPGDHFDMFRGAGVDRMAAVIRGALDEAAGGDHPSGR